MNDCGSTDEGFSISASLDEIFDIWDLEDEDELSE